MLLFLSRLLGALIIVSFIFVITQDFQIFPSIIGGLFVKKGEARGKLAPGITSTYVESADGKRLEVWRCQAEDPDTHRVAVFFHGNAGTVDSFVFMQEWLARNGITSFGFDYRGYGRSNGWPSERGLYLDGEAVIDYALKTENLAADRLILVGMSLGSGPAAVMAAKYNPELLLLLAPYSSLPDVVKRLPVFGLLAPLLWYELPTRMNVEKLKSTALIVAHGHKDEVIPFELGERVFKSYNGSAKSIFIPHDLSDHNSLFWIVEEQLTQALNSVIPRDLSKNNS